MRLFQFQRQYVVYPWLLAFLGVLMGAGMSACRPEKTKTPPRTTIEAVYSSPSLQNVPDSTVEEVQEDVFKWYGRMVFVQDGDLWMLEPYQREAQLLFQSIEPHFIYQSPDERYLLFANEGRNRSLYVADMRDNQAYIKIDPLRGTWWQPLSWSPDGEWVALLLGDSGVDLLRLDGTLRYEQVGTENAHVFWLDSGDMLVIEVASADPDPFWGELLSVARVIEAETGEKWTINVNSRSPHFTWPELDNALTERDLQIVPFGMQNLTQRLTAEPVDPNASPMCRLWQLTGINGRPVYSSPNTYRLSNLSMLYDGKWLFLEWSMPNCQLGVPEVRLMKLDMEKLAVNTVSEGIFGGIGFSQFASTPSAQSPLYDLSPNGQYIVWVGGGVDEAATRLNVYDLKNERLIILYEELIDQRLLSNIQPYISAVFWLPE